MVLIYQWLNSSQSIGLPSCVELENVSWLVITHSSNWTPPMKLEKCETSLKEGTLSQWALCAETRNGGECESFTRNQATGLYSIAMEWPQFLLNIAQWKSILHLSALQGRLRNAIRKKQDKICCCPCGSLLVDEKTIIFFINSFPNG